MKSFDSDIKRIAEKTSLKAAERRVLRDRVLSYMEYHPLPETMCETQKVSVPSFTVDTVLAWGRMHSRSLAGTFMAVFVVLVVPFAAEKALPGDVLYPIKTKINESILASFADSPYERVAFETELMERRIAEARLLAKEGKLSETREAAIAETVKGHASAVQEGIAALKTSDAEEAAIAEIAFSSTLEVQSAVLSSGVGGSSEGVAGAIRDAQLVADGARGTTTPSYDRLSLRVDEGVARATDLFSAIDDAVTDEERTDVERRLGDINRKIETARLAYEAQSATTTASTTAVTLMAATTTEVQKEVNPIETLSAALRDIQKLILFMADIDVRQSVKLEDIVPAERTDEERTNAVLGSIDELMNVRSTFDADIELITNEEALLEIASSTDAFDASIEIASSTVAEQNFDDADAAIIEAQKHLETLKMLLTELAKAAKTEVSTSTASTTKKVVE